MTPALLDRPIATGSTLYQPARTSPSVREARDFYERGAPVAATNIRIQPFDANAIWLASFMEQRLNELLRLPEAWDGHRAKPVALHAALGAADAAFAVASGSTLPPQIFPLADGGVQLEWHAAGRSLEIEVTFDGAGHVLAVTPDGTEIINEDLAVESVRRARAVLREIAALVTRAR